MSTETGQTVEATKTHDPRHTVQCACGYEWKVESFAEGIDVEMCIVCGSITVHSKRLKKTSPRLSA
jgi:hypothetical protein